MTCSCVSEVESQEPAATITPRSSASSPAPLTPQATDSSPPYRLSSSTVDTDDQTKRVIDFAAKAAIAELRHKNLLLGLPKSISTNKPILLSTFLTLMYRAFGAASNAEPAHKLISVQSAIGAATKEGLIPRQTETAIARNEQVAALAISYAFHIGAIHPGPVPASLPMPTDIQAVNPNDRAAVRLAVYYGCFQLDRRGNFNPEAVVDGPHSSLCLQNLAANSGHQE